MASLIYQPNSIQFCSIKNQPQSLHALYAAVKSGSYFSFRSSETVNFLRPLALREANTLRPLAVSILFLKP